MKNLITVLVLGLIVVASLHGCEENTPAVVKRADFSKSKNTLVESALQKSKYSIEDMQLVKEYFRGQMTTKNPDDKLLFQNGIYWITEAQKSLNGFLLKLENYKNDDLEDDDDDYNVAILIKKINLQRANMSNFTKNHKYNGDIVNTIRCQRLLMK